jgi:hypothetical protein
MAKNNSAYFLYYQRDGHRNKLWCRHQRLSALSVERGIYFVVRKRLYCSLFLTGFARISWVVLHGRGWGVRTPRPPGQRRPCQHQLNISVIQYKQIFSVAISVPHNLISFSADCARHSSSNRLHLTNRRILGYLYVCYSLSST